MSTRGQTLRELLAPLRERYFISGEINTALDDRERVAARLDMLAARYADGGVHHMDGRVGRVSDLALQRCGRPTPSRCCG